MKRSLGILGALFVMSVVLYGCPSAGIYRTAKTLHPGEYDVGTSFNFTKIIQADYTAKDEAGNEITVEGASVSFPNVMPELNFHIGIVDDLEIGGRVATGSLLIEMDVKWRFLKAAADKFHMAIQPAIGYFPGVVLDGPHFTLPLILTYELTDWFSITGFGYGKYIHLESVWDDSEDLAALTMDGINAGGGIGLQFNTPYFYIMPAVDISSSVTSFDDTILDGFSLTTIITSINIGWIGGKHERETKEQLDRMENKLDKALDNGTTPAPTPAPAPTEPTPTPAPAPDPVTPAPATTN